MQEHPWHFRRTNLESEISSTGVLAPSPKHFAGCSNLVPSFLGQSLDWQIIPKGLEIRLPLSCPKTDDAIRYVVIPCHSSGDPTRVLAIPVIQGRNESFRRLGERCIFVRHDKWHHWQHKVITFAAHTGWSSTEHAGQSQHRAGIWIRSLPPDFSLVVHPLL